MKWTEQAWTAPDGNSVPYREATLAMGIGEMGGMVVLKISQWPKYTKATLEIFEDDFGVFSGVVMRVLPLAKILNTDYAADPKSFHLRVLGMMEDFYDIDLDTDEED